MNCLWILLLLSCRGFGSCGCTGNASPAGAKFVTSRTGNQCGCGSTTARPVACGCGSNTAAQPVTCGCGTPVTQPTACGCGSTTPTPRQTTCGCGNNTAAQPVTCGCGSTTPTPQQTTCGCGSNTAAQPATCGCSTTADLSGSFDHPYEASTRSGISRFPEVPSARTETCGCEND